MGRVMHETFDIVIGTKGIATILVLDFALFAMFYYFWERPYVDGLWRWMPIGTIGIVCVITLWFTVGAFFSKLVVSYDVLEVSIPMYSRTLALADVDIEGISVITADERDNFRPAVRTNA